MDDEFFDDFINRKFNPEGSFEILFLVKNCLYLDLEKKVVNLSFVQLTYFINLDHLQ